VAVAVGPGQGEEIANVLRPQLTNADIIMVEGGSVEAARGLASKLHDGFYDALVGIGGGRTLDVAKYAASLSALPMVAVATNLAHDGIASPVASLESEGGRKLSYGVQMPTAVVIDLDYVRRSEPAMRRSGIGDAISNLSAIADWRLAERERGESVDGVAVTFARTAAMGVLHRRDGIDDEEFLIALAEGLVLSGLAMATAGSSRPCSGGDHEIVHAIDHLFPGTAGHGELAGAASLFTTYLHGDERLSGEIDGCLTHHGLPRTPGDLGLGEDQFVQALLDAPATRPDRFTVLEHLAMDEGEARTRVRAFADAFGR
jgi:glycerol-1-phosphate dehydrogenase [NAD(P)+]